MFTIKSESSIGGLNSRKGYILKRLVLSNSTSGEVNPNLPEEVNPGTTELLEEYLFDLTAERSEGKPGFISFHGLPDKKSEEANGYEPVSTNEEVHDVSWFVGPTVLVSFLVLPSLFLRKILSLVFEDSLLTGQLTLWCFMYIR